MNYLNDRIKVSITFTSQELDVIPVGVYTYQVKRAGINNDTTIFIGNFFWNGESTYTFDITDIVNNDKWIITAEDITNGINSDVNLMNEYYIVTPMNTADDNPVQTWTSNIILVAKVHPYPNFKENLNAGNTFFDIANYTQNVFSILLQGTQRYSNGTSVLIPEYPLFPNQQDMSYSDYPFGITVEAGTSIESLYLYAYTDDDDENQLGYESFNVNSTTHTHTLLEAGMGDFFQYSDNPDYKVKIILTDGNTRSAVAAKFNPCYSKYYLFWQDRYGSFQSQPFNEKVTYSEIFTKSEVQNYENVRRLNNIQVQPKWKINSGWLKEEVYPIYESIFISPILILLDTETNTTYNVIVNGEEYTEKTYQNQKKLINISLELEENKKQNIIY